MEPPVVYDHRLPQCFGTSRYRVGVPSEGAEPPGTAGEISAPAGSVIPSPQLGARGFTGISERNQHGFVPPNTCQTSIQRCDPQNPAIVAGDGGVTEIYGENDAAHTPDHAGRALPHRNRHPAPSVFDSCQNFRGAAPAPGSARRTPYRGVDPRSAVAPGQRPPTLNMTLAAEGAAIARGMAEAARLLRSARLRDLLAAVEE